MASASATVKTMLSYRLLHQPTTNSGEPIHRLRVKSKKGGGSGGGGGGIGLSDTIRRAPVDISAGERVRRLVSEFRSLPEPIDRVKRLLHYAAALPELGESGRVEVNRVTGCTTQVWVEVEMDGSGRMRFRAGSDSEMSKGYCSCLIWVFDGAAPEEVLAVRAEELGAMNVGVVADSRVNTWQNVLVSMQKRTKILLLSEVHPLA